MVVRQFSTAVLSGQNGISSYIQHTKRGAHVAPQTGSRDWSTRRSDELGRVDAANM